MLFHMTLFSLTIGCAALDIAALQTGLDRLKLTSKTGSDVMVNFDKRHSQPGAVRVEDYINDILHSGVLRELVTGILQSDRFRYLTDICNADVDNIISVFQRHPQARHDLLRAFMDIDNDGSLTEEEMFQYLI